MLLREGNVTVVVADLNRAIHFYTETLGLRLRYRSGDEWAEVMAPGLTIGLLPADELGREPSGGRERGNLAIGFTVDKLETARRALEGRGVRFHRDIEEEETVRIVCFEDPDGTPLYLCELRREVL